MGFLRRIFGGIKSGSPAGGSDNRSGSDSGPSKNKRRWRLIKQSKGKSQIATTNPNDTASFSDSLNANKHAIAVAAATAAVAEAALAAAQAAAEVVRLTSGGGGDGSVPSTSSLPAVAAHGGAWKHRWPEEIAAVKIQSAFRGYLAKRALRALKALVKLQALVRGHIVRKKTADMLRRMQTLVRLQSQARAGRVHLSHSLHSTKSPLSQHPVPEYYEHPLRAYSTKFEGSSVLKRSSSNAYYREIGSERARFGSNWFDRWTEENVWDHPRDEDDEKSNDKILEVDTWKPQLIKSSHNNEKNPIMAVAYEYDSPTSKKHSTRAMNQTLFGSLNKFQWAKELQKPSRTAESSPEAFSSSSWRRRGHFTPTRSECGYMGHPNYMANTESSRAKVRSMSVPRQRLWDSCPNSEGHAEFRSQQYFTSSTHLGRIGSSNLR